MTVADVSSAIQVIEQRIASISPTAARIFGNSSQRGGGGDPGVVRDPAADGRRRSDGTARDHAARPRSRRAQRLPGDGRDAAVLGYRSRRTRSTTT